MNSHKIKLKKEINENVEKIVSKNMNNFFCDGMSLSEIGNYMGVTPERVRQLENSALKTLRENKRLRKLLDILLLDVYDNSLSQMYYSSSYISSINRLKEDINNAYDDIIIEEF